MRGRLAWLSCVLVLPLLAGADGDATGSGTLLSAMSDEMQRTVERLRLEQLSRPCFVAYTVEDRQTLTLEASFGAITRPRLHRVRELQAELRVGTRESDDNHFIPSDVRSYAPLTTQLPLEDDYEALRFAIWSLSDRAYKRALERLSKKRAYRQSKNITEIVPDRSDDEVLVVRGAEPAIALNQPEWESRVRRVSAVFRDYPRIQSSRVRLLLGAKQTYFVDSEGRRFVQPARLLEIRMSATGMADDGMRQHDERVIVQPTPDDHVSGAALEALARQLADDVTALTEAQPARIYLGPVLFEGQAAGELFNQLLASGFSSPRSLWIEPEWAEAYFKPGPLVERLGLRVISPLFDAYDDPTQTEFEGRALAGHYRVDDEGIPAQRVDLIEDGILQEVLMSRSPTKERTRSNGHGRSSLGDPVTGQIGNLFLKGSKTVSTTQLKRRLRTEARAFGLDHGLIIRRIAPESKRDRNELISPPAMVYRIDVETGEEQLLRDVRFRSVTLRALRDVIAASSERHVYNVRKKANAYFRGTHPVSIVHPSVLLSEMELSLIETKPEKPPYLPHPYFTQPAAAPQDQH